MSSRLYNSSEGCLKLGGCTQKTLAKWAKEAGVEPQQKGREQLYTLDQLRQIRAADPRRRVLLSDAEAFSHGESREVTATIERYEREVEGLRQEIAQLREAMQSGLEQEPNLQLEELVRQIVVELLSSDLDVLALISEKIRGQVTLELKPSRYVKEERVTSPAVTPTSTSKSPATPSVQRYERPSNKTERSSSREIHTWTADELFEERWIDPEEGRLVSRARMAKAHSIPDTNIRRDIEGRQVLAMVNKKHLFRGVWRTGGFNTAQRRQIWEMYHELSWFNPCEICIKNQHTETEEEVT